MRTYATRWARACLVTAAVGVALALEVWNPVLVLVLGMVSMVPALVGFSLHAQTNGHRSARLSRAEIKQLLVRAAGVGAGTVATCAFVAVSPPLAITLALAGVVTSPWFRRLAHRGVEGPARSVVADDDAVDQLGIDELCRRWCATFHAVLQKDPPRAARIVAMRQVYLDEMERRDPAGLRAWLMSDPHAGGSPERFLAAKRDPGVA